jgi:hypothetical protein
MTTGCKVGLETGAVQRSFNLRNHSSKYLRDRKETPTAIPILAKKRRNISPKCAGKLFEHARIIAHDAVIDKSKASI